MIQRLANERIGWLTTVAPDGTPQSSPIWFLWTEDSILIYSVESSRTRNLAHNPRVSLNLDGDGKGGGIVVIEGRAVINESLPSAAENTDYLAKYKSSMERAGCTPEWFAGRIRLVVQSPEGSESGEIYQIARCCPFSPGKMLQRHE